MGKDGLGRGDELTWMDAEHLAGGNRRCLIHFALKITFNKV